MPDEIADDAHLIGFIIRNFHVFELIFDHDHQFEAIEPVGAEIIGEVRFLRDPLDVDAQMLCNERAKSGWPSGRLPSFSDSKMCL